MILQVIHSRTRSREQLRAVLERSRYLIEKMDLEASKPDYLVDGEVMTAGEDDGEARSGAIALGRLGR